MNNNPILLNPEQLLDDQWFFSQHLPLIAANAPFAKETEKNRWIRWLRSTRIEIAENALTTEINFDHESRYLKTELVVNILVPKGHVRELRIFITLKPEESVIAVDGFPHQLPQSYSTMPGTIKLAINKGLKLIPVIGNVLSEVIDIQLGPWDFSIGNIGASKVLFSGAHTSTPEWYFRNNKIEGYLRLVLTIQAPKQINQLYANIRGAWLFDPGFMQMAKIGTEEKTILLFQK